MPIERTVSTDFTTSQTTTLGTTDPGARRDQGHFFPVWRTVGGKEMPFWSRRCPPTTGGQGGTSSREKAHLVEGKSAPRQGQERTSSRARARLIQSKGAPRQGQEDTLRMHGNTPSGATGRPFRRKRPPSRAREYPGNYLEFPGGSLPRHSVSRACTDDGVNPCLNTSFAFLSGNNGKRKPIPPQQRHDCLTEHPSSR
jgi:hypothetical protein